MEEVQTLEEKIKSKKGQLKTDMNQSLVTFYKEGNLKREFSQFREIQFLSLKQLLNKKLAINPELNLQDHQKIQQYFDILMEAKKGKNSKLNDYDLLYK